MVQTASTSPMPAAADGDRQRGFLHRTISEETKCIAFICLLDLLTTLYWVTQGVAREGNPVLAFFLGQGIGQFIVAKLVAFVPSLVAAEWYRPRNPALITRCLRLVIVAYILIYVAGVGFHVGGAAAFYRALLGG